jgi:acyl-CoA synthetase (AMP-forming)/AMP-acid ligase II
VVTLLDQGRAAARLGAALRDHGECPALLAPDGVLSYAALADRVDDVAARLGSDPRLVLVPLTSTVDAVTGYLAALSAGHPVLVTDGVPDRTDEILRRFDPDVVIVPTGSGSGSGVELDERRPRSRHVLHPDLALLLSTSGSTGSPRLVRLSHANLLSNATAIADYLAITPDDRAITSLPLHYCYGLSVLHSHIQRGAGIALTDRSVVDACFWDAFRSHEVTSLAGVPYTFELLDRAGFAQMPLPSLRVVTQAGGRLAPEHVSRLAAQGERDGWDLVVMYGQTEATARMAYLPPALARAHPGAIGIPIPGGALRLAPCDHGDPEVGELVYEGPNVMLGYADDPADLAAGATLRELRTGDLARRTAAGLYEIVGRRSRFAKVGGLRIDLEQVEHHLREAGLEAMCASDDERIAVAVTAEGAIVPAVEAVQAACGLPPSRIAVAHCATLPRRPNGKPDHVAVLHLVETGTAPDEPAGTDAVRAVLQRLLAVDAIDDSDTFVSLGGDSLSYVEASIALESIVGELPPDWPNVGVAHLVAGRRPPRRVARTETSVVLRAIGIVLVVGTHIKLFDVLGGAHLMLVMAGCSLGRFQDHAAGRWRSIARIAVPSALWLAMAMQINDRIRLPHPLFVHGWIGADDAHGGYWFIEALLQILVPLTLLLAVPAVRRLERTRPFHLAAGALAVGLLVRFHVLDLPTAEPHDIRPHDIFWLFAIGWAAAHAREPWHRVVLSAVVIGALPGYFGEPPREVLLIVGLLLLLWVPTLPVPRFATGVIALVAGASLYVYLSHWQVFPPVREALGEEAALVACLAAGVLLWRAARAAELGLVRLRSRWTSKPVTSGAPRAAGARGRAPAASSLG